jgi:Iodothyronine deiodinase
MEKMFQDYRDIAEFRLIYIREAHAADGDWPMPLAKEKGILEHTDYEARCTTAKMLLDDKSLTIPTLIDGMDNKVNETWQAWPDRIFLVRSDGRLAVAAGPGPSGFAPALDKTADWLKSYRESGTEPELDPKIIAEADARAAAGKADSGAQPDNNK